MRKVPDYIIRNILGELPFLKTDNVIDEETFNRIRAYYANINQKSAQEKKVQKEKNKANQSHLVFVFLSIISVLFIGGGIIALIAFNWNALSRRIKTVSAMVILVIPQLLAVYFLFINKFVSKNKSLSHPLKEGLFLFWAIIFGAIFAFIAQVYKTASTEELFVFFWALSTLAICYIMYTNASLVFFFIQTAVLIFVIQEENGQGFLLYPGLLLVIPLLIRDHFKTSKLRKYVFQYSYLLLVTISLAVSLEKTVPGLWIILYSAVFAIFCFIGLMCEKNNPLHLSPFKLFGFGGFIVLSYLLLHEYFWENIGWRYFREGIHFRNFASIFDVLIIIITVLAAIALFGTYFLKNKKNGGSLKIWQTLPIVFPVVMILFYVTIASGWLDQLTGSFILAILMLCTSFYFLFPFKEKRTPIGVTVSILLVSTVILKMSVESWQMVSIFLLLLFSLTYLAGTRIKKEFKTTGFVLTIIGAVLSLITLYVHLILWKIPDYWDEINTLTLDNSTDLFNFILFVLLFVYNAGLFLLSFIKKEKIGKDTVLLLGTILFVPLLYLGVLIGMEPLIAGWILFYVCLSVVLYKLISSYTSRDFSLTFIICYCLLFLFSLTWNADVSLPLILLNNAILVTFYTLSGPLLHKQTGNVNYKIVGIIGSILTALYLYGLSFASEIDNDLDSIPEDYLVFGLLFLVFSLTCLVIYQIVEKKIKINWGPAIFALFCFLYTAFSILEIEIDGLVYMWLINLIILLYCLNGFYLGVIKKSKLLINMCAIFIMITFLSRFFTTEFNLVIKGIILICSGIILLILNIVLMRMDKKKSEQTTQISE